MKLFTSLFHADEDETKIEEGRYAAIFSSKEDLLKLCSFFEEVKKHISEYDNCHMHFRDSYPEWNKENHIDIEINIDHTNKTT
jgi:hypothetical protein